MNTVLRQACPELVEGLSTNGLRFVRVVLIPIILSLSKDGSFKEVRWNIGNSILKR